MFISWNNGTSGNEMVRCCLHFIKNIKYTCMIRQRTQNVLLPSLTPQATLEDCLCKFLRRAVS